MRLLEGLERYGRQMHLAIKAMVKDVLNIDIQDEQARELTNKLGLSDVLALDTAIDDQNTEAVMDIVGQHIGLEEYSLPNRGNNLKSQASQRPTTQKRPAPTSTTQMTKPVAGGNKTATGGADEIGQDDNDAQAEIDKKQAEVDDLKKKAGVK